MFFGTEDILSIPIHAKFVDRLKTSVYSGLVGDGTFQMPSNTNSNVHEKALFVARMYLECVTKSIRQTT